MAAIFNVNIVGKIVSCCNFGNQHFYSALNISKIFLNVFILGTQL